LSDNLSSGKIGPLLKPMTGHFIDTLFLEAAAGFFYMVEPPPFSITLG
jgi:hypothetical protein